MPPRRLPICCEGARMTADAIGDALALASAIVALAMLATGVIA
jgi:hypothetical protein